jgi:TonB family protein
MFDKLIESQPSGAEFKNRRGYFMMSAVIVGVLFLTAVVISIYAADFAFGADRLDLEAMLAPAEVAAAEPEPAKPRPPASSTREHSDVPTRRENMARTDESTFVPNVISSLPNAILSRPPGDFRIGNQDANPIGSGRTVSGPSSTGIGDPPTIAEKDPVPDVPPVKAVPPVKPPPLVSIGVLNGKAVYLPKPPYPASAIAINAQGKVDVQIMIDEHGKVVSAKAVDGHPMLRGAAEQAAWGAKFTPTLLSNVPVKVTGVIVYNFTRN